MKADDRKYYFQWVKFLCFSCSLLTVQGNFDGKKLHGADMLDACMEDSKSKGKKGLCILSSGKKKPFLSDPKFLQYKGFKVCDEADNGIQLWYLPFTE